MTILQIPVSKFSKSIIESENRLVDIDTHPPTIFLRHSDTLFLHLCCGRQSRRLQQKKLDALLTESISIAINDNLAAYVHPNIYHIGYYLNEIHREKLNETIWWEVRELHRQDCALEAKQVIECFCERYNIELDVAVNYDTLYRAWTRYKQDLEKTRAEMEKNTSFFYKNRQQTIRQNCKKNSFQTRSIRPNLTDEQLDQIIMDYFTQHEATLFRTSFGNEPRKKLMTQLRIYVHHEVGQRPIAAIAKHFKLKPRTVYYQVASFRNFLLTAPPLNLPANLRTERKAARQRRAIRSFSPLVIARHEAI